MIAHRRRVLRYLAGASAVPALSGIASGSDYPTRAVRIVIGFAPGGVPDLVARLAGQWLSERLGQPFVAENHPGAASNLALQDVSRAAPDGYTLLEVSLANAINASLYPGANLARDIAPVASIASAAFVVVAAPAFGAKTVPELIDYARSHPGKLNFGSSATGTPPYLAVSLLKTMANMDVVQVPYRNSPEVVDELLAGRLDVAISDMSAIQLVKAGKLRALAVTTATRQKAMPAIASLAEFLPGYEASTWYGLGAAKQTASEIIGMLNAAIGAVLTNPEHVVALANLGLTVDVRTPGAFGRFVADQTKKWAEVIAVANIKPR